jgi:cytoskeletal protein CcmA (bactofilin family)
LAKNRDNHSGAGELSTILGSDAVFDGHLKTKASMRIDGKVKGELITSNTVTIGSEGVVEGTISAKDVVVGGRVVGTLNATGRIILEAHSVLNGDLKTSRLVVEDGATFNGSSDMGGKNMVTSNSNKQSKIRLTEED